LEHIAVHIAVQSRFLFWIYPVIKQLASYVFDSTTTPFQGLMAYLFHKPHVFKGVIGGISAEFCAYLGGFRFRPSKKISEDFALEAFGFLEATVLKTFLKDSTIWL
jgi:hypothetical protein